MKKKATNKKQPTLLDLMTPAENKSVEEDVLLTQRIAAAALRGGATQEDTIKLQVMPLMRLTAILQSKMPKSRGRDQNDIIDRDWKIVACACEILSKNNFKPRGLAGKIKKQLRCKVTERTINRILDERMPKLFVDPV